MRTNSRPLKLRASKNRRVGISRFASRNFKRYVLLDQLVSTKFNGEFTVPITQNTVRYNIRMIDSYCKAKGKKPENLTREELNKFVLS